MTHPEHVDPPPAVPTLNPISTDDRRGILAAQVATHVHNGYRVESQTDVQATLVKGRRPNHVLHLILSIITAGLWAVFVWFPIAVFGGEKRQSISVDAYGIVNIAKGRG